jgi:hypothetical protein
MEVHNAALLTGIGRYGQLTLHWPTGEAWHRWKKVQGNISLVIVKVFCVTLKSGWQPQLIKSSGDYVHIGWFV